MFALVRWELTENGEWKGDVIAGDVPRKIVFIDGAKRGRPLGVEPEEDKVFLTEIMRETKPGERRGVLFARPLRPARMGWVPTGEEIAGARRHEWACVEEGFFGNLMYQVYKNQKPTAEPEENKLFWAAKKRAEEKRNVEKEIKKKITPVVVARYGRPDSVQFAPSHHRVELEWEGIGKKYVFASELAKGWREKVCPPDIDSALWEEVTAPWTVEYLSLDEREDEDGGRVIGARFRLKDFPECEFREERICCIKKYVYIEDAFFTALPKGLQEEILASIRQRVPDPIEAAREYFSSKDFLESARNLARFRRSEYSFERKGEYRNRYYPESPDGYRAAFFSKTWVTYGILSWSLPGEGCIGSYEIKIKGCETLEEVVASKDKLLVDEYTHQLNLIKSPGEEHPYAKFLTAERMSSWNSAYFSELEKLKEEALTIANSILRGNNV